ncbi:MAG TPA: hypothetical protein VGR21_09695, partial [Cryptosporangiaceae bacterium]|nr:hypothetical protein [Cryptosporangiaceae bacterium]
MSSLLEDRYRRALRVLPAYYRDAWEEDMVATFLEASYAAHPDDPEGVEMSSPSRSERASILRLAVRLRLGGPDAAPRHFVWGEAVRRVALVGLFGNAVTVLAGVAFSFWLANGLPGVEIPADAPPPEQTNRLYAVLELASLLWLPAFLCLIYGRRKAAWVLALVAFAPQVVTFVFLALDGVEVGNGYVSVSSVYQLVFGAVPVLALAAFHRAAPPVRPRPWLLALPLGVVVAFLLQAISLPPTDRPPFLDWPAQWCVGVIAGSLVLLAAALARRSPATPQWALALALLAAAVFGLRVVTLVDYLRVTEPAQMHPAWVTAAAVEAAAVLVVGLVLAVVAGRALRR